MNIADSIKIEIHENTAAEIAMCCRKSWKARQYSLGRPYCEADSARLDDPAGSRNRRKCRQKGAALGGRNCHPGLRERDRPIHRCLRDIRTNYWTWTTQLGK